MSTGSLSIRSTCFTGACFVAAELGDVDAGGVGEVVLRLTEHRRNRRSQRQRHAPRLPPHSHRTIRRLGDYTATAVDSDDSRSIESSQTVQPPQSAVYLKTLALSQLDPLRSSEGSIDKPLTMAKPAVIVRPSLPWGTIPLGALSPWGTIPKENTMRRSRKLFLLVAIVSSSLGFATSAALAGLANGANGYYSLGGVNYWNWSSIYTDHSSNHYAYSRMSVSSGANVGSGWMGVQPR